MSEERVLGFVEEACRDAIVAALDAARDEAARRVIEACGCKSEDGCESPECRYCGFVRERHGSGGRAHEFEGDGCRRFVRAVRGEGA